jgi:hypothetical protein
MWLSQTPYSFGTRTFCMEIAKLMAKDLKEKSVDVDCVMS